MTEAHYASLRRRLIRARFIFILTLTLALVSCAGLDEAGRLRLQNAVNSLDRVVSNGDKTDEMVLRSYETMYRKYPGEPIAVGAYADALRRMRQPKHAAAVLKPFVEKTETNKLPAEIFMPYMRLMLDQGFAEETQKRLEKRLSLPPNRLTGPASRPQLQNLLGSALAAQNKTEEAEQAFTRALAAWDGRPGVVERNLERLHATKQPAIDEAATK